MGAAELLRVPVDLQVFGELLFVGECLVAALEEKGGEGEGGEGKEGGGGMGEGGEGEGRGRWEEEITR